MILYCVRHGETVFNAGGRIQGQLDTELSAIGQRQGQAVVEALAPLPIEAVYTSPLRRAAELGHLLADRLRLTAIVDPRLKEIHAGIFQGHGWDEIDKHFPAEAARWKTQDPDFRIPEGESRHDLMRRAGEAFAAIRETGAAQVAVVAHGGLLSAAFKVLLEIPPRLNPFSLDNGSISKLACNGRVKLLTLNATDHLHGLRHTGGDL